MISSFNNARDAITSLDPEFFISIRDPGTDYQLSIGPGCQCLQILEFHDVTINPNLVSASYRPPDSSHINKIVEVGRRWNGKGKLLINCWAGVSRSSAAALVTLAKFWPDHIEEYATRMRQQGPWLRPNPLLVRLADDYFKLGGRLTQASATMGKPTMKGVPHFVSLDVRVSEE